ncbi:MAG TPA: ABC transporter permease [Solirubrobacteraceae bacterium]|jgi:peptide/nickel transport system permease protein|nr:ABC transporter permease [Solirubrobacteraceae bacterium]
MTTINPSQVDVELVPEGGEVVASGSPWRLVGRTFVQNKLAILGVVVIVLLILFCYIGPLIHSTDQLNPNLAATNQGPGGGHLLGTDSNGYDILGRLMEGGKSSIEVGFVVGIVSTLIGLIYGAISGYFGGFLDGLMMRLVDIGLAIPLVFLFIFAAQIYKPSLGLLMLLLVIVSWLIPARLVRGEALTLRTREYVQAVKVMGGTPWRIIIRHLVPNTIGTIVVTVTFQIANAILTLAVLQYLGFGLPASTPTWGGMLSDGTTFLQDGYWWEVYPALIIIVLAVVAFNFIGDALQDSFDVRLQER